MNKEGERPTAFERKKDISGAALRRERAFEQDFLPLQRFDRVQRGKGGQGQWDGITWGGGHRRCGAGGLQLCYEFRLRPFRYRAIPGMVATEVAGIPRAELALAFDVGHGWGDNKHTFITIGPAGRELNRFIPNMPAARATPVKTSRRDR